MLYALVAVILLAGCAARAPQPSAEYQRLCDEVKLPLLIDMRTGAAVYRCP